MKLKHCTCYLIFLFCFLIVSCSPSYNDTVTTSTTGNNTKHTIRGKAAIGAFIEEGAIVQVRPAPVSGVPSDLIQTTVQADGYYEIDITNSEATTKSETVDGDGFIIRVWSESTTSWIYSYAENSNVDVIANVNPYTDMMIRRFYATGNNENYPLNNSSDQDINNIFVSGVFHDGTSINVPTAEIMYKVMDVMSKMLYRMYGLTSIQNALNDSWQVDLGLDALLNASGRARMNEFLKYQFSNLYFDPDVITDAYVVQNNIGEPVIVDIWTPYGFIGSVKMIYTDIYGSQTVTMSKQLDSTLTINHYRAVSTNTGQCNSPTCGVYIVIDDYNGGLGFEIAMRRP